MSVIQSTQPELRYTKRQNLENEARIVGNYYRDLIRSYGIDCIYHKLDTSDFSNFKNIIDQNTILKHAYGYNFDPDYSVSAHVLSYMEVENDLFQLNKFGLNPNADVNFYFEMNDFACALATKVGVYKEYPINETTITCEVPEYKCHYEQKIDDITQTTISVLVPDIKYSINRLTNEIVSSDANEGIWPYELGLGYAENYYCNMLSGKLQAVLSGYELNKETTIVCNPYEHTDFNIEFAANSDLYQSLKHVIENDDYLETMLFLKFKVSDVVISKRKIKCPKIFKIKNFDFAKVALINICNFLKNDNNFDFSMFNLYNIENENQLLKIISYINTKLSLNDNDDINTSIINIYDACKNMILFEDVKKFILTGKIFGNVLFYDLNEIGKYAEKIHPMVGDLVTIDFPDENNRETYEITDCFDKQLTNDGISPLLHKYIWKCKARRYVNSYEDVIDNEANNRLQEKIDYDAVVKETIVNKISKYNNNEDSAYGSYELEQTTIKNFDKEDIRNKSSERYEYLNDGTLLDIQIFKCGSKLCTNGYELFFINAENDAFILTTIDHKLFANETYFPENIKWLKASKSEICFINIEGQCTQLVVDEIATNNEMEICLNSMYDLTYETTNINKSNDSFIKFNGCKSYLFATENNLFAKLESNKQLYKLV